MNVPDVTVTVAGPSADAILRIRRLRSFARRGGQAGEPLRRTDLAPDLRCGPAQLMWRPYLGRGREVS